LLIIIIILEMLRIVKCFSILLFIPLLSIGQQEVATIDSTDTHLHMGGDFRFRIEHDWNSQKSDGTYRMDRSRLRYRFRFGLTKQLNKQFQVEARIRTGNLNDQQGPHVTLGKTSEFGLTSLGFEKASFQYKTQKFWIWVGKNSFPFWKQHELLWNDNVFPEGVALGLKPKLNKIVTITPTLGHFIINSNGQLFDEDQYLSAIELNSQLFISNEHRLIYNFKNLFFHNIANIPDGKGDYFLNYNILSNSLFYSFYSGDKSFSIGVDWYQNTSDYTNHREKMKSELVDEKMGFVAYLKYGQLKSQGDIEVQFYYANIGKYAIVDYFAQNDWARWDYSNFGATGSRLSNFRGIEVRVGYKIIQHTNIILRYYSVQQLITTDSHLESGSRIRIDLNIAF